MKCYNCGYFNSKDALVCKKCHQPLDNSKEVKEAVIVKETKVLDEIKTRDTLTIILFIIAIVNAIIAPILSIVLFGKSIIGIFVGGFGKKFFTFAVYFLSSVAFLIDNIYNFATKGRYLKVVSIIFGVTVLIICMLFSIFLLF